ncbi:MAG: BNR-4 repeat-containing protein [Lentisphaeria bacterium]|nr:BNR-4 repeat-containing protein [Lentisphaeria bacterium]
MTVSRDKADGYRGIWFTLGQYYGPGQGAAPYASMSRTPVFPHGDKYSGGLGTYTAKHVPLAVHCAEAGKTFFVYGGTPAAGKRYLLCMAGTFDHASGRVTRPTIVHDKGGVDDPHDNPSIAVDGTGHVWVFVSGRGRVRPGFVYRSTAPYSTDAFERTWEGEMTYPQPKWFPGRGFLLLFTKYTGVRELYYHSSLDGRAWSEDRKLAGIREPGDARGGHYQTSAVHGDLVGTFFNRHPDGDPDRRTDIYYLQTRDMGQTWTTVDGRVVPVPLAEVDNPARVMDYASQHRNVYLKDMGFDARGRPVYLYVTSRGHQPGPPNDPREWCICRWTGTAWRTSSIAVSDHNYDMGSLYIEADRWLVIAPTEPGPQPYHGGGEMVYWESRDQGETWRQLAQVTQNSPRNHNYARRPLQARDPFYVFWADGDPTALSPSLLYFANSTGDRVWRLPEHMDGESAVPEPVRP